MDVPLVSNKELTENVNMNQQKEVPEFLGGLGDLLPADVLKKLNELLEQLHQKEKDHQGGISRKTHRCRPCSVITFTVN